MAETDYFEPLHALLDWEDQHKPLNDEEYQIIDEADRQVVAYTGKAYADVRQDVLDTALTELETRRSAAANSVAKVLPLRTVYVVKATPIAQ